MKTVLCEVVFRCRPLAPWPNDSEVVSEVFFSCFGLLGVRSSVPTFRPLFLFDLGEKVFGIHWQPTPINLDLQHADPLKNGTIEWGAQQMRLGAHT